MSTRFTEKEVANVLSDVVGKTVEEVRKELKLTRGAHVPLKRILESWACKGFTASTSRPLSIRERHAHRGQALLEYRATKAGLQRFKEIKQAKDSVFIRDFWLSE